MNCPKHPDATFIKKGKYKGRQLYKCRECHVIARKKHYEKNKEKLSQKHMLYYESNKEKIKLHNHLYHQSNKEYMNEKSKNYYESNKEKIKKQHKIYYKNANPKIIKKMREKSKELDRRYTKNLERPYLKKVLKNVYDFKHHQITNELMDTLKILLLLRREIRNRK